VRSRHAPRGRRAQTGLSPEFIQTGGIPGSFRPSAVGFRQNRRSLRAESRQLIIRARGSQDGCSCSAVQPAAPSCSSRCSTWCRWALSTRNWDARTCAVPVSARPSDTSTVQTRLCALQRASCLSRTARCRDGTVAERHELSRFNAGERKAANLQHLERNARDGVSQNDPPARLCAHRKRGRQVQETQ
jgi:hypothetical protein